MALDIKPKFVTFDMNGTLIHFRINDAIREVLGDRLPAEIADDFLRACSAYRIDECMGEDKPFHQIVGHSLERPCADSAWSTAMTTPGRCTTRSPRGSRTPVSPRH